MATKDPHLAMIDAHEQIQAIQRQIQAKIDRVQARVATGYQLSEHEKKQLRKFRERMIDQTRRIQDNLADELQSHGLG